MAISFTPTQVWDFQSATPLIAPISGDVFTNPGSYTIDSTNGVTVEGAGAGLQATGFSAGSTLGTLPITIAFRVKAIDLVAFFNASFFRWTLADGSTTVFLYAHRPFNNTVSVDGFQTSFSGNSWTYSLSESAWSWVFFEWTSTTFKIYHNTTLIANQTGLSLSNPGWNTSDKFILGENGSDAKLYCSALLTTTATLSADDRTAIVADWRTELLPVATTPREVYADGGIIAGSTNVTLLVPLPAQTTSGSAGVKLSYTRTGAAAVTSAVVANTATGAHTDWSLVPCDPTNIPELHRVDLPDAAFAAEADQLTLSVSATGMATQHFTYALRQPASVFGSVIAGTLGTTAFSTGLTYGLNQLARRVLEFTSGACVGQRVAIVGNTALGVLRVAPPLTVAPAADDTFTVL